MQGLAGLGQAAEAQSGRPAPDQAGAEARGPVSLDRGPAFAAAPPSLPGVVFAATEQGVLVQRAAFSFQVSVLFGRVRGQRILTQILTGTWQTGLVGRADLVLVQSALKVTCQGRSFVRGLQLQVP